MWASKLQAMPVIFASLWTTGLSIREEIHLDVDAKEDPFDAIGKKVNLDGPTLRSYIPILLKMAQCAGQHTMYLDTLKVDPGTPATHTLLKDIGGKQPKKFKTCIFPPKATWKVDQAPWKEAKLIGLKPNLHKDTSSQGDVVAIQLAQGPIIVSVKGTGGGGSENCRDLAYEYGVFSKLKNIPTDSASGLIASSDFVRSQMGIAEPPTKEGMISGVQDCSQKFADVMPEPYTGGPDAFQESIQDFVELLRAKFSGTGSQVPIIIMGHSAGGDIAMRAACHAMAQDGSEVIGLGIGGGTASGLCPSAYQIVHALDIPQRLGPIPPEGNAPVVLMPTSGTDELIDELTEPERVDAPKDVWGTDGCKCASIENFCKKAPTATFEEIVAFSNRWSKGCCRISTHASGVLTELLSSETTSVTWGEKDLCPSR